MVVDNNGQTTNAMTCLNVEENMISVEELILGAKTSLGFKNRQTILHAHIGVLTGSVDSTIKVPKSIRLILGTAAGQTSLVLHYKVYVASDASIHLPRSVFIEESGSLEVHGNMTGVRNVTISSGGVLTLAYPVSVMSGEVGVVKLNTLRVDYDGRLEHSGTTKVMLNVSELQTEPRFTPLDNRYFVVPPDTQQVALYRNELPLNYTCEANDEGDLHIFRKQFCYIATGTHNFRRIIIDSGAELRLEGNGSGIGLTTIESELVHVYPGGIVTGVATGFVSNGPGSGQAVREAGSYGGLGGNVRNASLLYGDMAVPREYGSNGFNGGPGGGQIEFVVTTTFINSGVVNFNGKESYYAGGSGGSIYITAKAITGSGIFSANGGRGVGGGGGGGGGGRIAFKVKQAFEATFHGKVDVSGGPGSHPGASGIVYIHSWQIYLL